MPVAARLTSVPPCRPSERRRLLRITLFPARLKRESRPGTLRAGPRPRIHRPHPPPSSLVTRKRERVGDSREIRHDRAFSLGIRAPAVPDATPQTIDFDSVGCRLRHTRPRKPHRSRVIGEHGLIPRRDRRRRGKIRCPRPHVRAMMRARAEQHENSHAGDSPAHPFQSAISWSHRKPHDFVP